MERMLAIAPDWWAVVTGILDSRATSFIGHSTDTAAIFFNIPLPNSHSMPSMNARLHHRGPHEKPFLFV